MLKMKIILIDEYTKKSFIYASINHVETCFVILGWIFSTNWTRWILSKPLVYATSMKMMIAFWYRPYSFFGLVLAQTYWASVVVWIWKIPCLPKLNLRI